MGRSGSAVEGLEDRIHGILNNFRGEDSLKRLVLSELGYERESLPLNREEWTEEEREALAADPLLVARAGAQGRFHVIYCRLDSDRLSVVAERQVVARISRSYEYALFIFSNRDQTDWHFVNVPYSSEADRKRLHRRIAIGPSEGLRTPVERLSMLAVDRMARAAGKPPEGLSPLELQAAHDRAFDVEAVGDQFFRRYREVFQKVESSIEGISTDERRRIFTQHLFNRLMFVAFIQKKGWLRFRDRASDYLSELWEDYVRDDFEEKNFYRDRLKILFFKGLNNSHEQDVAGINDGGYTRELIGRVPYLNGGLFEKEEDDDSATVPDDAISEILSGLFEGFNFTVTESTPLDKEVAVDPEMLGRVFEELVTGRHESGSYYTPKPIVSFMCREALKGHLETQLSSDSSDAIRAFVDDDDPAELANSERALEALREVRACDPACGSGAYLLGMLQELLELRHNLFASSRVDDLTTYQRKLEIIRRNLYGVDIDPFAVNIARLRLWLSLVVEDGRNPLDDPSANVALPNLDLKIEAGDSLTAPDPSGGLEIDMYRAEQIPRLDGLKADYLKSHGEKKKRLRGQIDELRQEIADWAHPGGEPEGFDWQVEFAEVFKDGGFDAVLANPPYVRQELIRPLKPKLREVFPEVYTGTADLYVYFYGRALQLLKEGGMLSFISSNKWFRANYGKRLRAHIANTSHVRSITDFGELPVFESAATFPTIFTAQKERNKEERTLFTEVESLDPPYPEVAALIREAGEPLPPEAISGEDWLLTDAETAARLTKMRAAGIPLGEYVNGRIYYGIKTGFNEAFVIDGAKREELISRDPRSKEIIKPMAVGDDIRKWCVRSKDKWLIFTRHGIDLDQYPVIKEHLAQWKAELTPKKSGNDKVGRKPGSYEWYEIQDNVAYYEAFEQPKIAFPDIAKESRFALDTKKRYVNNTTYFIPIDDLYLIGVLNSSHVWDYAKEHLSEVGNADHGGRLRFFTQFVRELPIPAPTVTEREAIGELVQECLDTGGVGCEEQEREIDERVARLYGL